MTDKTIEKLQKKANEISKENGFWDDFESICKVVKQEKPSKLSASMDAFYSQKIALIVSELSEGLEAMRQENFRGKDGLQEELADTVIRIMDLCEMLDFDLQQAIVDKMEVNKDREEKHGKNF